MKKDILNLFDGGYIKFQQDGKDIAVLILRDETPSNPRLDCDNPDTMVCFHRRYNLGDPHKYKDPTNFFAALVKECLTADEILKRVHAGNTNLKLVHDKDQFAIVEHFTFLGKEETAEVATAGSMDNLKPLLMECLDDLEISTLHSLLSENEVAILPLYLYDHSGITMNTTGFCCPWDSGQVGHIYMTKKQYRENQYEESEWPAKAYKVMKADVEVYDQYLTGEVYGYQTFEKDDELGWVETDDSCWGFFGSDILTNGIAEDIPGLKEAIESGAYETGTATEHRTTTVSYEFS